MTTKLSAVGAGVLVACVGSGCVGAPGEPLDVEEVGVDSSRCIVVGPEPHGRVEGGTRASDQGWAAVSDARVLEVR